MKVYVIESKENIGNATKTLSKFAKVVHIPIMGQVSTFKEIYNDPEEKIIAVAPRRIEWSFPKESIAKIPNLRAICSKSQWIEYIDLEYCRERNITVTNTHAANSQSVAEYAIWMMFSLARKLPLQINEGFSTKLDPEHTHIELQGKIAGIIGLGNIGSRIAKMADGIGMNVIYWSRNKKDASYEFQELNKVLANADVVFNCLEVCKGTDGMLNTENLSLMKNSAYFVSILGGMGWGVADDDYIIKMVAEGNLAGFSIENDHKDKNKYKDKKFEGNIFIPASNAWYTKEAVERTRSMWIESIVKILLSISENPT